MMYRNATNVKQQQTEKPPTSGRVNRGGCIRRVATVVSNSEAVAFRESGLSPLFSFRIITTTKLPDPTMTIIPAIKCSNILRRFSEYEIVGQSVVHGCSVH